MAIGAREDIAEQAPGVIEDHQRLAWQGRRSTVAQRLEPPLAGGQAVAVEVQEAIARQALGPGATELIDQLGGILGGQAHQPLRGRHLDPLELVIDGHDGGGDRRLPIGGIDVGLHPADDLQHQPDQRGEQDLARVLRPGRRLEPALEPLGVEQPLQQAAHHHARRRAFGKTLQDTVKHPRINSRVARRYL
ncbi:hypothetical protein CCR82_01670 [Halochromatium salexigens]|uniref:Uncharacterized protein n=1 Tax=Halochromatium salexigens TaxID=49447 RepID=A0AAJ0UD43_HALSE|nr:hypothetical protein [Halochromatium salexigens]